jgi:homogentisate 1,2-dioxygenase
MCKLNLEGTRIVSSSAHFAKISSPRMMVRPGELLVVQRGMRFKVGLMKSEK